MIAADVEPPRGHLHQGAIFTGVPLLWYTDVALELRPRHGTDHSQLQVERAATPAAFMGNHLAVAWTKRRPVVVVSPRQELRRGVVRVLAMFGYRHNEEIERARPRILQGEVPSLVHVAENKSLGWTSRVISLSQVIELPRSILDGDYVPGVEQSCSLSDGALALVLTRLRAYLALTDRGRPRR